MIENQTVNYSEPRLSYDQYLELQLMYQKRGERKVMKPVKQDEGRLR